MTLLISVVLGLMLFALGTSLTLKDFERVLAHKRAVLLGLTLQMVVLPLVAFVVSSLAPIGTVYKVGLVLVALCPGGATSNFISYLLKADTALSVSLTAINSLLILFSIPILTAFTVTHFFGEIPIGNIAMEQTLWDLLLMLILPIALGLGCRAQWERWAVKSQKFLKITATLLLALVFALKIFGGDSDSTLSPDIIMELLPYALTVHLIGMGLGYWCAKGILKNRRSAVTIGIEVGLQNTALALWVAEAFLGGDGFGYPALVYGLFSFFTTLGFGYWVMCGAGLKRLAL